MRIKQIYYKLINSNLVKGFIDTLIGSGLSKLIIVILTFYCTNHLSKEEFGEFSFVRNTLNMLLCICALNFSSLCTKFTVESKVSKDGLGKLCVLFLFSFIVCLIIGLSLILLPDRLLIDMLGYPELVDYFRVIGLFLPLYILQPLIEGILRGFKKFRVIGVLQTASSIFFLIIIILGIKIKGVRGAISSILFYYLFYSFVSVLTFISLKKSIAEYNFTNKSVKSLAIKNISSISTMILPIFVMSFIEAPVFWVSQIILSRYGEMEAIGSMTVITQVRNIAVLIPSYFFSTFLAFAGEMNANKQYQIYFHRFNQMTKFFLLSGLFISAVFSCLAKPILSLYSSEYIVDFLGLIISNLSITLILLVNLLRLNLVIQEHQRELLFISAVWNIIWLLSFIIMLQVGIDPIISFFSSQLLGYCIQFICYFWLYNKDKRRLNDAYIK